MEKAVELKFNGAITYTSTHNVLTTGLSDSNPYWLLLNGLTQGSGSYQRVGNIVQATSVRVRGQIFPTNGGTNLGYFNRARIMIIRDRDANGTAFNLNVPFTTSTKVPLFNCGASPYYPQVFSRLNVDAFTQYEVLADSTVDLITRVGVYDSADGPHSVNCQAYFDIKVPLSLKVDYGGGTGGGIGDILNNSIYVLFIIDSNVDNTVHMDAEYFFKDA